MKRGRKMGWMKVFTGKRFDVEDIQNLVVDNKDVARSLSRMCRYGGHTVEFYSVAEHVCLMSDWFLDQGEFNLAYQALTHDDSEAYMVDLPKPVKDCFPDYKAKEEELQRHIAKARGLQYPYAPEVHHADLCMLRTEFECPTVVPPLHMEDPEDFRQTLTPLPVTIQNWDSERAFEEYMSRIEYFESKASV